MTNGVGGPVNAPLPNALRPADVPKTESYERTDGRRSQGESEGQSGARSGKFAGKEAKPVQTGLAEPKAHVSAAFGAAMQAAQSAVAPVAVSAAVPAAGRTLQPEDLLEEMTVLAQAGPAAQGLATGAGPSEAMQGDRSGAAARGSAAEIAQKVTAQVQASEAVRLLAPGGKMDVSLPIAIPALGIGAARMVVTGAQMSVMFQIAPSADPAVVAAAMQDLAARLAQQYPSRAIRLLQENEETEKADAPSEFNPFTSPVRRST